MNNNFVKPTTVMISDKEYIRDLIEVNLQKDMNDDEEICQFCHGTGLVIQDNPYGLSEDPNKQAGRFPYKHQSITFCGHCYNGVTHRCTLCGNIMPRGVLKHDCPKQRELDIQKYTKKEEELLDKAKEFPAESIKDFVMLYDENYPHNEGYFTDWEEYIDWWNDECKDEDKPEFVWGTNRTKFKIDADNIIEMATEDLYEDASNSISSKHRDKLIEFFDKWCAESGVGDTFFKDTKSKVRIPWEDK